MEDDNGGLDIPRELRIRQLAMMATRLIRVFEDTWQTYLDLFDLMDLDDIKTNGRVIGAVGELEAEVSDILIHIREQMKMMKFTNEPMPTDKVEDFEQSILTTLAALDTIDLNDYRRKETND